MTENVKGKKTRKPVQADAVLKNFLEELLVGVEGRLIERWGEVAETEKTLASLRHEVTAELEKKIKGQSAVEISTAKSLEQMARAIKVLESTLQSKLDRLFNQAALSRRTAVFIDGQNLEGATLRAFPGMRTNFDKLLEVFNRYGKCLAVRAYFSEENLDGDANREARIEKRRNFFRVLEDFGYYIYAKTKKLITRDDGSVMGKANCDVEISHDMTTLVDTGRFDAVILVSGDSDFAYLLQRMRDKGIYTIVIFTEESLSFELRKSCDEFVSLQLDRIAGEVFEDRPRK